MVRIHILVIGILALGGCTAHNQAAPSDLVSAEAAHPIKHTTPKLATHGGRF